MAEPKKGYKSGVYRLVSGTVDGSGDFSITNIPKEGYVPGIYQLTEVSVDGDGNTTPDEDDIGITRAITVTVDGDGNLTPTDLPEEGYVSGVYRVTTSTNIPKEGFNQIDFSAVIGTISGGKWESGPAIQFSADLTNSLIPSVAIASTPTFTRADTDATVTDFEGLIKKVTANEARFFGARRVENLVIDSEDFTNAGWTKTNTTATADQLTATAGNATTLDSYTALAGDYVFSVELQRVSGTGNIQIAADSGTYTTVTLTGTYQRFSVQQTVAAGAKSAGIRIVTSGDVINARNAQLELVEGQTNQNPSEYVSVGAGDDHGANQDGVKYFNTQNGNTVASNVVTEATGSAISSTILKGVMVEEQRTNLWDDNEDLSTKTGQGTPTFAVSATLCPLQAVSAWEVTDDATAYENIQQIGSIGSTETIVTTTFIKKETGPLTHWPGVWCSAFGGTSFTNSIIFDTTDGSFNNESGRTPYDVVRVIDYNTDWWKVVTIMANNGTGNTSFTFRLYPAVSADGTTVTAAATGTTTFAIPQIEVGELYETSLIPTNGASATRNAEALSYPNTNILDAEGTLALSFTPNASTAEYTGAGDSAIAGVRGTNEDLLYIDSSSGETAVADGTGTTTITAMPSLVSGTTVKLAARWSATSSLMDIGQDGTEDQVAFDGSMNKTAAITLGYSGANRSNGSIKLLRIYEGYIDDSTFTGLTT